MSKILDRAGVGAALSSAQHDTNFDTFSGINVPVSGASDTVDIDNQNDTIEYTNGGAVAVTLDSIATIITAAHTSNFKVTLLASGAGTVVTITPNGLNTINTGVSTIVLTENESVTLQTDDTNLIWNIISREYAVVTAGTAEASKPLVLGATKNIDTVDVAKDGLEIGGTAMACTAAELNVLDHGTAQTAITVAGTDSVIMDDADGVTCKVDVNDLDTFLSQTTSTLSNKRINNPLINTALVEMTATSGELNHLDGSTASPASVTLDDADGVIISDASVSLTKLALMSDVMTYVANTTSTFIGKTLTGPRINNPAINEAVGMTTNATELNLLDGSVATAGSVTLVDADGVLVKDGTVTKLALMSDVKTYVDPTETPAYTPTITGSSGGSPSYTTQVGTHHRTGKFNWLSGKIVLSSVGTLAGTLQISLPDVNTTTNKVSPATIGYVDGLTGFSVAPVIMGNVNWTGAHITLIEGTTTGWSGITHADITNTFNIEYSLCWLSD